MDERTRMFLAAVSIILICFGYLFLAHFWKPTGADSSAFFISIASGIVGFYWGSSKGSQDKNDLMKKE